ncbi:EF-hand [Saitoella complicata NRRL Y-17804]|uniref:EF-hand n=1 Tax=Saitoella complicata (strain BCRC 22490 / CBS 7301 / JCM 7358 / NBRC 10748 / NRRL Y-17804) TaxID=698492 RepID=UPI000866C2F7|nr:EF-hand [Saitoella complicata NRRL Y-17804]ODQ52318.1 EF-hand [Saitoella complicata NRRL Y-17804]
MINQHASQGRGQRTGTPTLRPELQAYWQLQHHHPAQHLNQPTHQPTQPTYQSTQPTHPQSAPDVGHKAELLDLFQAVDTDRSGHIEEKELNLALRNADWSYFDARTVAMMIRLFDADRSGHISFIEFQHLWGYLDEWKQLFDRFDSDRSGTIDFNEYRTALEAFGYRLSPEFIGQVFHKFAVRGETFRISVRDAMCFDRFVQSCVILKLITKSFNKRDTDGDGYITVSFQDLVGIMLELQ